MKREEIRHYSINDSCGTCAEDYVVVFDSPVGKDTIFSRWDCIFCLEGVIPSVVKEFKEHKLLPGIANRHHAPPEAEFHLWLLKSSTITPSDLIHPNIYIREYANDKRRALE